MATQTNSKLGAKSSIIKRTATQVVISNAANGAKTTSITLGALGLTTANGIKSVAVHKFSSTIYQLVDYSYDLNWSANSPEAGFVVIHTYNGHQMDSHQNFEINVAYVD